MTCGEQLTTLADVNEARTIERILVDSSNIKSLGYAEDRQILAVEFIASGAIFHYRGVPLGVFEAFGAATSRGAFFAREIRGKFSGERMDGLCPKCLQRGLVGEPCEHADPTQLDDVPCTGIVRAIEKRKS